MAYTAIHYLRLAVRAARRLPVTRALQFLWGGARLDYGVAHGASMALVKGRIEPSGPILRRADFDAYGQEIIYAVPLRS